MQKNKTDKRSWLIQTAAKLAYRQGFRKTTLADIAEEAQVPLGSMAIKDCHHYSITSVPQL